MKLLRRKPSVQFLVRKRGKYSLPDEYDAVTISAYAPLSLAGSSDAAIAALRGSGMEYTVSNDRIFVMFDPDRMTEEQAIGVVAAIMKSGGVKVDNLGDAISVARRYSRDAKGQR